jgi:hypothetical protein
MTSLALYFAGAETPAWRKLLINEGVPHVAVTYAHLLPRLPKGEWRLAEHFPDDVNIFLDSGAFGINRKHWTPAQHESFLNGYFQFVQSNLDRLVYFTECDFVDMGLEWVQRQRSEVWDSLSVAARFVPVWHEEWGAPLLREMVEQYKNLGVPPLSDQHQNVLAGLVRRTQVKLHGLSFSHRSIPSGVYSTIVSSSWVSPMRFGETVIWDHNRLRRYPAGEKEKIRRRHRQHFTLSGFDADKICDDDNDEVARYTIWAWRQLEHSLAPPERKHIIPRRPPVAAIGDDNRDPELPPSRNDPVVIGPSPVQDNGHLLPERVQAIPVFAFQEVTTQIPTADGGSTEQVSRVPVMIKGGLRQCSSCSLATVCPKFDPGAACSFSIPVEIRNRDQLVGILSSLLEMQAQRVAFGFFGEQLQGGYPDANLSAELDRFMRMTLSVKEIEDNRDFLKVSIEGRAQGGILRRLFGAERAETLHQVDGDRAEQAVRNTMRP